MNKKKRSYVIDTIKLHEGQQKSDVTILKLGKFFDPRYNWFDITQRHFDSFIKNFSERVYDQDLPIDLRHMGDWGGGAAGWVKRLFQEGNRLRAEVEWTELGLEKVIKHGFKYLSSEFEEDFKDNETGEKHGPTLLGAGLTIRPVIKGLDPIALSEAFGGNEERSILLHEDVINELTKERQMNKDTNLKKLSEALVKIKGLPAEMLKQLSEGAKTFITGTETDENLASIISSQVQLAENLVGAAASAQKITAVTNLKTLSSEDVQGLVRKELAESAKKRSDAAKQLSDQKTSNIAFLETEIKEAKGIGDPEKKTLSEGLIDTISGLETEAQITAMVGTQVKLAEASIAKSKLLQMGFTGNVRVVEPEAERNSKALSEKIDDIVGYKNMPDSMRYPKTGKLHDINKTVAEKQLAHYDKVYAFELAREGKVAHKMLAGEVGIADTALPYTVMRTVFREALYNLISANIIAIDTASSGGEGISPTVFIPYVERKTGGPTMGQMNVFEGQPIPYAGMTQKNEMAYVNARKLAMKFSNEVAFFTAASRINYDAVRDNTINTTRMMQELMEYLLLSEMVNAADEFSVVVIANENRDAQTDAVKTTFQLANYPLVKPRKTFDLQGNQVGSTVNPMVVTFKGGAIAEYDGSNTQASGDYYKISNYSLGQFQIVSELGVVQTPGGVDTLLVSYSYTTNIVKWDKNFSTGSFGDHLNNFLNIFGRRKATLYQDRFSTPNFAYMSAVLNNMATEATKFESARQVEGSSLTNDGNLAMIKGIPTFGSNVPLDQLGDLRLIMGERFTTTQKVVKPFAMNGGLSEVVDPTTGQFTGERQTYGEQYDAVHTPKLNKGKYTEILVFDSTTDIGPF